MEVSIFRLRSWRRRVGAAAEWMTWYGVRCRFAFVDSFGYPRAGAGCYW